MYNPDIINSKGKINKPSSVTPDTAQKICEALGLTMTPEELISYFEYSSGRKEISFNELYILDSFYQSGDTAIRSFKTDDPLTALTYGDLVDKHRAIYGEDAPVTLDSLLCATDEFIEKYVSSPRLGLSVSSIDSRLEAYCRARLDSPALPKFDLGDGVELGIYRNAQKDKEKLLDQYSFISLIPSLNMTREEYEDIAYKTVALAQNLTIISNPVMIGKRGVIGELVRFGVGATVNIDAYPENPACHSLASILSAFEGYVGFLALPRKKAELIPILQGWGLIAVECAITGTNEIIDVFYGGDTVASLDIDYLRDVKPHKYCEIVSRPEFSTERICVEHHDLTACATVEPARNDSASVYFGGRNAVACASCNIDEYVMQNGIFASLLPIFELAAKGINRRNITIAKRLFSSDEDPCAVDAALALHKVQCELAIRSDESRVSIPEGESLLYVGANGLSAPSQKIPADTFIGEGDIYVLSVVSDGVNGIDYKKLRMLIDYLTSIATSGSARTARVFIDTPLDSALASMKPDNVQLELDGADGIKCPTMYVIVESPDSIRGTRIGKAVAFEPSLDEVNLPEN